MRCPYCNGLNNDKASFCTYCGRDLVTSSSPRQQQPPRPATPSPYPSTPKPPLTQQPLPRPSTPVQSPPRPATPPMRATPANAQTQRVSMPSPIAAPTAPEPPAPFPPRTMAQLAALESGALSYSVIDESESDGRKKQIRILYPRCAPWQQMATLLKAHKELQGQTNKFNTVIIQGVLSKDTDAYRFTNGQLCFDRNVRLGENTQNRYQIETSNGFDADAIRIVLTE